VLLPALDQLGGKADAMAAARTRLEAQRERWAGLPWRAHQLIAGADPGAFGSASVVASAPE
jgi:hypothetical protein